MRDYRSGESDQRLMERMARKDEAALEELYDSYGGILFSLALAIVRDRREAENVVQMTFLKVWRRAASYDGSRAALGTWLAAIARNQAIDQLRKQSRGPQRVSIDELRGPSEPTAAADVFQQTLNAQRREIVLNALETIPEEQREALLLAYFSGLSQSQVAEQLKQPLGTIKTRIRLGLEKLRESLKDRLIQ